MQINIYTSFDEKYYKDIWGTVHRHDYCEGLANNLITTYHPKSFLDIGTGCGFLVKTLREKGDILNLKPGDEGRDHYDLIWFLGKGVIPNWLYLRQLIGLTKAKALDNIKTRIAEIDYRYLQSELSPYFSSLTFVRSFIQNLLSLYNQSLPVLKEVT